MSGAAPVAVLTGGGRGIGGAAARELHARGYRLALMSPSGSAEALAAELGAGAVGISGATQNDEDIARLVEAAMTAHGRIDAVVNHTGGPPKGELLEISDDDWRLGLDLVVLNVVRMLRRVTPIMLAQGGGAIVNVTTFSSFEPSLTYPVSSALRAGLASFAKLYADRYAADGIRINNVLPGFIDSLNQSAETAASVPMKRIGKVEEMAKTIAFLLSDDAGYITGQSLRVDGGLTRHI